MSAMRSIAFIFIITSIFNHATARELHSESSNWNSLEARLSLGLKYGGGLVDCWNAMMQLRSCSNEILLFFTNGESRLGLDCCFAVRTITHNCWPSMLKSVGFTDEEGDFLRGFCDAETANSPAPHPSSSVAKDGKVLDGRLV